MSNSTIAQVAPAAQYSITEIFSAVSKELEAKQAYVAQWSEEWQKGFAGQATVALLESARDTLLDWIEKGATHIQPEKPFADGNLLAPTEDLLATQFKQERVTPLVKQPKGGFKPLKI